MSSKFLKNSDMGKVQDEALSRLLVENRLANTVNCFPVKIARYQNCYILRADLIQ